MNNTNSSNPIEISPSNDQQVASYIEVVSVPSNQDEIKKVDENKIIWKIIYVSIPWIGIGIADVSISATMKEYLRSRNASNDLVNDWIPPIFGILGAIYFGLVSDRYWHYTGCRRRYIYTALAFVVIPIVLFIIFESQFYEKTTIIGILYTLFIFGWFGLLVQAQAWVTDVASLDYQLKAQAIASILNGIGRSFGIVVRGEGLAELFTNRPFDSLFVFGIGICCLVFFIFFPLLTIHKIFERDRDVREVKWSGLYKEIKEQLWSCPRPIRILCLIVFSSWCGWATYSNKRANWWGEHVYGGCQFVNNTGCTQEGVDNFFDGINASGYSLFYQDIVGIILSIFIATFSMRLSLKYVFSFGFALSVPILILSSSITEKTAITVLLSFMGISQAVLDIVPYALIGMCNAFIHRLSPRNRTNGIHIGLLYIFILLPILVDEIYAHKFLSFVGVSSALVLPIVFFLISSISAWFYRYDRVYNASEAPVFLERNSNPFFV